jgi:hypothetical protein
VVVSDGGDDGRVVPNLVEIGLDGEENVVRLRGGGGNQGARWWRWKSGRASYIYIYPQM